MIKTLLFDLDGTLIDFCDDHYCALNGALSAFGYEEIPYDIHLNKFNALTTLDKLKILQDEGKILEKDIKHISDLKQVLTAGRINNIKTDWNKVKIMQRLFEDGYWLGCVTNSIRNSCENILKKMGIFEYMKIIVCNEDTKKNKPYPDPYLLACSQINCNPRLCLAIEDTDKGIKSAVSAGCRILKINNATELTLSRIMSRIQEINTSYKKMYIKTI
jgi:beta-phosphoglucomutase